MSGLFNLMSNITSIKLNKMILLAMLHADRMSASINGPIINRQYQIESQIQQINQNY